MNMLDRLKSNTSLPIVMAPMFLISNVKMVVAASDNGIIGTIPSLNYRTSDEFEDAIKSIIDSRTSLNKELPVYGVNLIVNKTNTRLQPDLEICVKYKVPLIITSLGLSSDVIDAIHSYGGMVFHDIINTHFAKKAIDAGVDGLIAISGGAGGHAGTYNPFALIEEIRDFYSGPLLLGGSINNGYQIKAAQLLGADMAYMGTRFIPTIESNASLEYKEMILSSNMTDIVYTDSVSGFYGNFLKESLKNHTVEKAENESILNAETKAWKDVWSAGQGVGGIKKIESISDIIKKLVGQYNNIH